MKNRLLTIFAALTLLSTFSCKKNDIETTLQPTENQRNISTLPPGPVSVMSPTVFFVSGPYLFTIKNLTNANPTVVNQGVIPNIQLIGPEKSNIFNTSDVAVLPAYDPFTDRMWNISMKDNKKTLHKCFTPTKATSSVGLSNLFPMWPVLNNTLEHPNQSVTVATRPIRVGKDKKLYYYRETYPGNDLGPIFPTLGEICRVNLDGTTDEVFGQFGLEYRVPQGRVELNLDDQLVYATYFGNIYASKFSSLDLFGHDQNIMVPKTSSETFENAMLRYDPINKFLYFSSKNKILKRDKIYSIKSNGDLNSKKLIYETGYTDENHTFNFDVSSQTGTMFISKREFIPNTQKHKSTVTKVNLLNPNELPKLVYSGDYINTILVAEPVN